MGTETGAEKLAGTTCEDPKGEEGKPELPFSLPSLWMESLPLFILAESCADRHQTSED